MMNKKGIGFLAIFLIVVLVAGAGFGVYKLSNAMKDNVPEQIVVPEEELVELNEEVDEVQLIPEPEVISTPIVECNSNWSCSSYGICKRGEKVRTCVDLNGCEVPTDKPSLVRKCSSGGSSTPVVIQDTFGVLVLTHKNLGNWTPTGEDNLTLNYTLTGKTFQVLGVPEGYIAVYYSNRFDYSYWDGLVILPSDIVTSLPIIEDLNGDVNLSDYCSNTFNPDALNCIGAKVWVVPSGDVINNTLTWANPNNYYFETDLITYTKVE